MARMWAKLARLLENVESVEKELGDLEVAKSVMLRLSGKKQVNSGQAPTPKKRRPKPTQTKPANLPTIKQLVLEALEDARRRGMPGLTPKQIREFVAAKYSYNMGASANTVPSRMWRDEKILEKNTETGLFSLPSKEKPVDALSFAGTSTGLFETPAKGREAGPGGGT